MNPLKSLFALRWQPTRDTGLAFAAGTIVILLSCSLRLVDPETLTGQIATLLILSLGIRVGIGYGLPLHTMLVKKGAGWDFFGLRRKNWAISLALNLVLAALLLGQFLVESGRQGAQILLTEEAILPIFYIIVAGVFEMVFIYGFLRKHFERAFGLLPSVILTALFYSLYHAGFQPEFIKLVFVGLLYAATLRVTENILIIFPFFWGVGATWDVLVNFGATSLQSGWSLAATLAALTLMAAITLWTLPRARIRARAGQSRASPSGDSP
jgi:hypothetical protein